MLAGNAARPEDQKVPKKIGLNYWEVRSASQAVDVLQSQDFLDWANSGQKSFSVNFVGSTSSANNGISRELLRVMKSATELFDVLVCDPKSARFHLWEGKRQGLISGILLKKRPKPGEPEAS